MRKIQGGPQVGQCFSKVLLVFVFNFLKYVVRKVVLFLIVALKTVTFHKIV